MQDLRGIERQLTLVAPLIRRKEMILYRCKVIAAAILVFLGVALIDQDAVSNPGLRSFMTFASVIALVILYFIWQREKEQLASLYSARSSLRLRHRIAKGEIVHD
jgi:predicted tellurium resistance membrane protein TerC